MKKKTKKSAVKKVGKQIKKSSGGCWEGYERVPGKTRGSKGSCKKKSA